MENVVAVLDEIKRINSAYELSTESITELQDEMHRARVCTPIIGKFSSGKSALVNTLLGYSRRILREDITPETAIPAEIVYSDSEDYITIIRNDGGYKQLSVEEYRDFVADANTVKNARIQLKNSFLEEIPDVMLVDMPGFESGFEIHNKAIDNYLPQSLAYIVAFPADDLIVRSSVGNILKELCLHDMPLCVVITKYDKRNDDFEITFEKMKKSLKRFVGDREIRFCRTSSFTGDVEELEEFLKEIQELSQDILGRKYSELALGIIKNTESYLKTTLNNSQLSESGLDEKEDKLHKQLSSLESKFSEEQGNFDMEISECVEEIKADVQRAMEAEEDSLVAMAMNNQNINGYLNSMVRNAVTVSMQKRFIPKVEKYLKRVAKTINAESISDVSISFSFDADKLNKGMTSSVVAVVAAVLIGGPLIGLVTGIIMKIGGDRRREKAREEAKKEIHMKLQSEVFPQVLCEIGHGIEMTIMKQVKLVNTSIESELKTQKDTLEKAMTDLRSKMNDEQERKENLILDINNDLERIGEMKDGLR